MRNDEGGESSGKALEGYILVCLATLASSSTSQRHWRPHRGRCESGARRKPSWKDRRTHRAKDGRGTPQAWRGVPRRQRNCLRTRNADEGGVVRDDDGELLKTGGLLLQIWVRRGTNLIGQVAPNSLWHFRVTSLSNFTTDGRHEATFFSDAEYTPVYDVIHGLTSIMPHCLSTIICSPFVGRLGQTASRRESTTFQACSLPISHYVYHLPSKLGPWPSDCRMYRSIHNLDEDSLLSIFNLCRPNVFEEDEFGDILWANRDQQRWWYKLVKVCRRWRYLILGSAPHLGLCLVCSCGTPVAEMLAHSPPLPLIVDHRDQNQELTAEDEKGIMFALKHRDRVQHMFLRMPVPSLQKVIGAMDDQFPMLKYLCIIPPTMHNPRLVLPVTFRAPQLSCLILNRFDSPIGSSLLTTAIRLVRLSLLWTPPSTNPCLNNLFQALSLLTQLQKLTITSSSPVPNREIERQMSRMPNTTHTTLPNLRFFGFGGVSAYLEAFLSHMNAPLLEMLNVGFFNQLSFSVPHLLRFVTTIENLRASSVRLLFHHRSVTVYMYLSVTALRHTLAISVGCDHLDWQVSSMVQISNVLGPLLSAMVDLTLDYRGNALSSKWHNQVDRTQWRKLLRSFRNVETLRVHGGLVGELSRCLALDGEPPSEILPELKTLVCPMGSRDDKTFAAFVHDREVAGLPIELIEDDFPVGEMKYRFYTLDSVEHVG